MAGEGLNMLRTDATGRGVLQYEVTGRIARIPLERRGTSARGIPWVLGGCLLEVFEEGVEGSARLYLITWEDGMVELLNMIGVGKDVRVVFHIETRDRYDSYNVSAVIDSINGLNDNEDYLYGTRKKGES